jgi:hypothetical protein
MIYELAEYVSQPGAEEQLHARFRDHTLDLFARHGLNLAGMWTDDHDTGRILYLLRFDDEDARERAWACFRADPNWQEVRARSENDGPIVAEQHRRVLRAVPYLKEAL